MLPFEFINAITRSTGPLSFVPFLIQIRHGVLTMYGSGASLKFTKAKWSSTRVVERASDRWLKCFGIEFV